MLTEEQYAQSGGTRCPDCGSEDIEGTEVNIDAGYAWQDVRCLECEAAWQDTYLLTGYVNLERKDSDESDQSQ